MFDSRIIKLIMKNHEESAMAPAFGVFVRALHFALYFFAENLLPGLFGKLGANLGDGIDDMLLVFHEIEVHLSLHLHREHFSIIEGKPRRERQHAFGTDKDSVCCIILEKSEGEIGCARLV